VALEVAYICRRRRKLHSSTYTQTSERGWHDRQVARCQQTWPEHMLRTPRSNDFNGRKRSKVCTMHINMTLDSRLGSTICLLHEGKVKASNVVGW